MEIDITRLKHGVVEYIDIDENFQITEEQQKKSGILDLKDVKLNGNITKDALNSYHLTLKIDGTMILPCSITLKPVEYPFIIEIDDNIEELLSEIDNLSKKIENTIDILPIIWENILMEIPIKVTSPEANKSELSGAGWKLVTEEPKDQVNPALEKLKDLL